VNIVEHLAAKEPDISPGSWQRPKHMDIAAENIVNILDGEITQSFFYKYTFEFTSNIHRTVCNLKESSLIMHLLHCMVAYHR